MSEPLTDEEKRNLLKGFEPAKIASENKALFGKRIKVKPVEFSRPPVVFKQSGVYKPSGLPAGRIDKVPVEEY